MAKKLNKRRAKRGAWFIHIRGSYLPISSAGWWTYVPFILFLLAVAFLGIKYIASSALKVIAIIIAWFLAAVVMTLIAEIKS